MRKQLLNIMVFALVFILTGFGTVIAQSKREFVKGGQFKDLILPMPILKKLTDKNIWGTEAVKPRDIQNGLESKEWCYWGGNPMLGKDGNYHISVARWPENKGHWGWPKSEVAHAVAKNVLGPYTIKGITLPEAHNPEVVKLNDGSYLLHVSKGNMYTSNKLSGPWKLQGRIEIDKRGHRGLTHLYTNLTGLQRKDGSFLFFTKRGDVMISNTGITGPYKIVSSRNYDRYTGYPEDPVIWKSRHQYHVVFNHAVDKKSVYMRSLDGIHWKMEPGEPYDQSVFRYTDGTTNKWCKFERPKVVQDEFGRATHLSLAVIDVEKKEDLGNDNHSSKHVILPLVTERIVEITNTEKITAKTKEVKLLIKAEKKNSINDIDIASLRLGTSDLVNFGGGVKPVSSKVINGALEVNFAWDGTKLSASNYDLKLLGKTSSGDIVYGYALLPEFTDNPASLVTLPIKIKENVLITEVENFGLTPSKLSVLKIFKHSDQKQELVKQFVVPSLKPYEHFKINLAVEASEFTSYEARIITEDEEPQFWTKVDDNHHSITYKGVWKKSEMGQNRYLASEQVTSQAGASASYSFYGTQARAYGNISKKMGGFEVYVDGNYVENINCYFGADLHNVVMYQTERLPLGLHTLELRATGKHYKGNPTGPVSFDAFSFRK